MKRQVLVTGWAGYIGPVVVRHLRAAGFYVIGLDAGWFLPQYAAVPDYPDEVIFGDLRDKHTVDWLGTRLGNIFASGSIVHLAGLSNDPMGDLDPSLTQRVNVTGTLGLVAAAPYIRHVIVSSCSVYGTAPMATEETPTSPLTTYAFAKDMVDMEAPSLAENTVSLRLGTVYGYSPGHRLDLVVNRMTYDAVRGRSITVNGNAARPLTHVEDVASAIVFMLDKRFGATGVYNVVGENWRMRDLADLIGSMTKARIVEKPASADLRDYQASGAKLAALGWQSEWGVGDEIATLSERSRALPGLHTRYERLAALKALIASGYLDADLRHSPERILAA